MTELQDRILDAALPNIAFDGWTETVFKNAATQAGLHPADVSRAFPNGIMEALEYFTTRSDARMAETLQRDYAMKEMKIRERIATAVMVRLRQNLAHREAVRRGLAVYALPWNVPAGIRALYRTTDEMWHQAGDTATDWNHYSKRIILSKVYMSTLYVWLDDNSPNLEETEAFLRRRIENVMQFEKLKAKVKSWRAA
jgi:ubiquinone biosynthesis protein COQ9